MLKKINCVIIYNFFTLFQILFLLKLFLNNAIFKKPNFKLVARIAMDYIEKLLIIKVKEIGVVL